MIEASQFAGVTRPYAVISADCHVNEPANLWATRMDARYRDRVPRVEIDAQGQKWSVAEGLRPALLSGVRAAEAVDRSLAALQQGAAGDQAAAAEALAHYSDAGRMPWLPRCEQRDGVTLARRGFLLPVAVELLVGGLEVALPQVSSGGLLLAEPLELCTIGCQGGPPWPAQQQHAGKGQSRGHG